MVVRKSIPAALLYDDTGISVSGRRVWHILHDIAAARRPIANDADLADVAAENTVA
jgi:hypothetical protein